jgi:hypothetical protein
MSVTTTLLAVGASAVLTAGVGVGVGQGQQSAESTQSAARSWPTSGVCSTFSEERNRHMLQERLDLLPSGQPPDESKYFTDDATVVVHGSVPYAGTYTVRDGQYGQLLGSQWQFAADLAAEPQLYADCDTVTLIGHFTATSVATGQLLDTTVIELFTFDAVGKIVRDDFYFTDTAEVNRVLGVE